MLGRLLLFFIIVPFIEITILIRLGDYIGFWPTFGLVILTGLIGLVIIRTQGFYMLQRIRNDVAMGVPPAQALIDGLYLLIGGILLIVPGLITDFIGLLLLFPVFRFMINRLLTPWLIGKLHKSGGFYYRRWQ